MALTYDSFVNQISNLLVVLSTDADFQTILPAIISYGENRIYRELDLVAVSVTDNSGTLTANSRDFTLPSPGGNIYVVVDNFNVIYPAGTTSSYGVRNPLVAVTPDVIDAIYPQDTNDTGVPRFWAIIDSSHGIVGPPPNANYGFEIRGQTTPTPLSSGNSSTPLTQLFPDLFIAACMIFASGWQKDFSAQGDDPSKGMSWEKTYQDLRMSASVQEGRKQYQSIAWTANQTNEQQSPPRV